MTSSKKYILLSLDANIMTLFRFLRVRVVWNRISNSCSFHPWYKNWILCLVLELFRFQKWHVFAHFCIILPIAARADFKLWRTRTALWKVKRNCKWMEIVNCRIRNPNFEFLPFIRAARAHNMRADTYGREILKCSKWPGSCSKLFTGDFEHVKILTRAHVRVVTRTGTRIVSMLRYDLKFMCIEFG